MNIEYWVAAFLIACLLVTGWRLRQAERRVLELEADCDELEAELRLTDRKLRRAQDELNANHDA